MKQKNQESQQQLKVESYEFEPIKGYPMLNWKGKRPFTSTQYFPAQLKESYGKPSPDGWMNKIFWGDNLQVMSHLLKEFRGKVDLIYIDPPFDSKAEYKKKIKIKKEKIFGDIGAFEEKQYSDIWSNDEYLQFMYDRLVLMKELLSEKGYLFLHCDSSKSHHLRCILDEIFGENNFLNEVIWSYRRWPSLGKSFQSMHDNIFVFTKNETNKDRVFNVQYEEASESYMKRFGGKTQILDSESGTRKITSEEETKGMPLRDVWDISIIAGFKGERTGYPTQKPEDLLERIIDVCTDKKSLVFDCFMGSGTTQAIAMKKGRKFIGADINLAGIQTTVKRLLELEYKENGFQLYNVNNYDLFRNPVEAKELLSNALEISKISNSIFDGEKDGRMVKFMPVNRIASKSDLNDLITGFDRKSFEKRQKENPNKPVEKILLVCMGHEPDLKAHLEKEVEYKLDIEIVDILRDKQDLQFKRESEAKIKVKKDKLTIEKFFPMNLLQKLSLQKEKVTDWRELVESVLIDWNYDGAVLEPQVIDIPERDELVKGEYEVPKDAGTIRLKITDLLSESIEVEVSRD